MTRSLSFEPSIFIKYFWRKEQHDKTQVILYQEGIKYTHLGFRNELCKRAASSKTKLDSSFTTRAKELRRSVPVVGYFADGGVVADISKALSRMHADFGACTLSKTTSNQGWLPKSMPGTTRSLRGFFSLDQVQIAA